MSKMAELHAALTGDLSTVLRDRAEQLAESAINQDNKKDAWAAFDKAWDLSEQAYIFDGNEEPRTHEEIIRNTERTITRMFGGRN